MWAVPIAIYSPDVGLQPFENNFPARAATDLLQRGIKSGQPVFIPF